MAGPNCWCGKDHDSSLLDLYHAVLTELKIPELVEWLARWLVREKGV